MGTSLIVAQQFLLKEDHPHAYGDKSVTGIEDYTVPGSSPRVWGQARIRCHRIIACGIIPTRMGTRPVILLFLLCYRDHPHAYGDKIYGYTERHF